MIDPFISIGQLVMDFQIRLCSVWIKKKCDKCGIKSKNFWLVKYWGFTYQIFTLVDVKHYKQRFCLACYLTRREVKAEFLDKL